ncbi:MAG TPA: VWA domain-containing protein [Burkholderiaceae bacterium]|jgi:Ca-activated chloride channel family protein
MNFLWPQALWLTAALPALVLLYVWTLRRRGRSALPYSSLALPRAARSNRWRRHVPPAMLGLACALLLFATARPTLRVTLPWARSTIMLAIDVSLSMRVDDVKPTRIEAAQVAAKTFLHDLPRNIDVGVVTFAGSAAVAQAATLDRDALASAVDAVQMQVGTAIGNAIVLCLSELFPDQGIKLEDMTFGAPQKARGRDAPQSGSPAPAVAPVAPGSYESAAIVLLSDGRRTTGVDTLEAAKMAADRGVRIYVVGLGTVDGATAAPEGMAIYMQLDEPTLREVARMTGGEYHHAGTAEDLRDVYQHLGTHLQLQSRETEVTAVLASIAAVLVVAGAALSMRWFGSFR